MTSVIPLAQRGPEGTPAHRALGGTLLSAQNDRFAFLLTVEYQS